MTTIIVFAIGMSIVLPAVFIGILWRSAFKSKLEWLLDALTTVLLVAWLFQSNNWSWVGYYFRYLWVALLIAALIYSWKKIRDMPFTTKYTGSQKITIGIYTFLVFIFGSNNVSVFTSYTVEQEAIELAFPLNEGTYYIGHGGDHVQMNYHQAHEGQKFALDILKLNKLGTRANGIYPKELTKYAIYGDDLYSPCNGIVVGMRNDLPDMTPLEMDPEHAEGNHVTLVCEQHEATILIAHMQQDSIVVAEGDEVKTGQLLGKIGNSGNTSEPHLHIHAEVDGVGVPLVFDGRFLVRNNLMKTGK